jgi:hypothetical protein
MAKDLFFGRTRYSWKRGADCGKSAAELWDEAESARLHRPVRYMSNSDHPTDATPPVGPRAEEKSEPVSPVLVGAVVGILLAPMLFSERKTP